MVDGKDLRVLHIDGKVLRAHLVDGRGTHLAIECVCVDHESACRAFKLALPELLKIGFVRFSSVSIINCKHVKSTYTSPHEIFGCCTTKIIGYTACVQFDGGLFWRSMFKTESEAQNALDFLINHVK